MGTDHLSPSGRREAAANAYVEQASARAHYEPRLVELSGTGGGVVWLAIGQVCPYVGDVHHGRKTRVPRPKFHGGYLR